MSFAGMERRQSPRIRVRVPVVLVIDDVEDSCETVEIGQGGVFVATFENLLLRQLVELRIELAEDEWLDIRGMVVRLVDEGDAFKLDTEPGVGIQYYGVDEKAESSWKAFFERTLKEAGFFEDADAPTLKGKLSTIRDSPPVVDLPEPIECIEDAQVMLARGFSVEQVSRAAGLDPSMVAAALAGNDELRLPEDSPEVGRTVEGISLLSSRPDPLAFEEEAPTTPRAQRQKQKLAATDGLASPEPITVRLKPKQSPTSLQAPLGPNTSITKIIGSDSAEEAPAKNGQERTDVDLVPPDDEPTNEEQRLDRDDELEGDLEDDSDSSRRIRLVAIGPLQPPPPEPDEPPTEPDEPPTEPDEPLTEPDEPPTEKKKRKRPQLVSVLSAPLAPKSLLPHVVYRLEMPSVAALEEFEHAALEAGGVFILTVDLRHTGTPVIVCIVHPVNHDEFHIPGIVTHSLGGERGVNVKFTLVTELTIKSYQRFITQGKTIAATDPEIAYPSQEITMVTKASEVFVQGAESSSIPRDTQPIKMSEIEPLKKE